MRKCLIVAAFVVVLLGFAVPALALEEITPPAVRELHPTPVIENDVFMGGQIPDWVTVCEATAVYGNPSIGVEHGSVRVGEVVWVRDASHDNTWIMIGVARWIPMRAVCEW
ncbi:MAG: hypothetical protein EHM33_01010 [Chloroflexi bacterium]|nr:MAG: hypothetical protein EHM33_01010 [Chloroflexota bacterium]